MVIAALVLAFTSSTRWLGRVSVTAPIAFAVPGAVISAAVLSSTADTAGEIRAIAEVTLALILFRDAAQLRPRQVDADRELVVRLLLVGLPLTLVVGYLAARVVFPAMPDAVLAEARVGRFTTASIADRSRSAARRFPLTGT